MIAKTTEDMEKDKDMVMAIFGSDKDKEITQALLDILEEEDE